MLRFTEEEIQGIELEIQDRSQESNLGFFSQPFRMSIRNEEYIVETYVPIKNGVLLDQIIENHDPYIKGLESSGVTVTETLLLNRSFNNKNRLVIIQKAYPPESMLRHLVINSDTEKCNELIELILQATIDYWKNKIEEPIGFHPTLRNYALNNGELEYFDTFPPMLMEQKPLNRIILAMSPFGKGIKWLVPLSAMNRVSNEYDDYVKMYCGILGSSCRLHPDRADKIISMALELISNSNLHSDLITEIKKNLQQPPKLSGIWTFIRKISGNEGKPNVK